MAPSESSVSGMQGQRETTNWLLGFGYGLSAAALIVLLIDSRWAEPRMGTALRIAVVIVQAGGIGCIVAGLVRRRRERASASSGAATTRN